MIEKRHTIFAALGASSAFLAVYLILVADPRFIPMHMILERAWPASAAGAVIGFILGHILRQR